MASTRFAFDTTQGAEFDISVALGGSEGDGDSGLTEREKDLRKAVRAVVK